MLKATEKLIELQTQSLQSQSSKKENTQPNRSNQQGCNQQSGSDQGSRKCKESVYQIAGKASSTKGKKGKQTTFKKSGSSSEDDDSDDQPEYAYLGQALVSPTVSELAGTKTMSNDMGPQPVFSWDSDDDIPEVYLHGRAPSLAQPVESELKLKVPGTDYVCRPGPYGIDSTTWELHARAAAKPPTVTMDNDVPELIGDEEYPPTLTVEPAVWDSLDERSRHLWGLEAIIVKSLEDLTLRILTLRVSTRVAGWYPWCSRCNRNI